MPQAIPIFADSPEAATLAMLINATAHEMSAGFDGWVKAPASIMPYLKTLATDGMAEEKPDEPFKGWWRATAKALSQTVYGSVTGRA